MNYLRNGYFHKHNISSEDFVKLIRNDTILLLIWLLGAVRMSESKAENSRILGIVDDVFDRLYRKVAFRQASRYILVYEDGVKHFVKHNEYSSSIQYDFDEYGYLKNAELQFVELQSMHINITNEDTSLSGSKKTIFIVDRAHLPNEMYMIDKNGLTTRLL